MKRTFRFLGIPLGLVLLLASLSPSLALDRQARLDVMSGVVQVSLVKIEGEDVYYLPWGSGTIVTADGLVLTNCHVADPVRFGFPPDAVPEYDYLGIGLTIRSDQPPQLAYLGEALQADPYLDLAVIRITHNIDGSPVRADSLNLPYVELGDSSLMEVGDELNIFGYPGIGGDTITFTGGVVSGFTLDAAIEGRAWIKTDATIAGGNSGGTAVDADGLLVGVPTRAGAGGATDTVDCRAVVDTNGDGRIDDRDACVPIGGFINAIRPVRLAEPLIERAIRGLPDPGASDVPVDGPAPTGAPRFGNLFFAPGVNEFNQPASIVISLPSGARSLYLFFDYENMSSSSMVEMKLFIDGREYPDWGLPAGPWGGGEAGTWWIGWDDADFVDGTYELILYADGDEMSAAEIEVGGPPQNEPAFSNLVLSVEKTARDAPQEPTVLIPAGTQEFWAFFDYDNMTDGTQWTVNWYQEGEVLLTDTSGWDAGASGSYWFSTTSQRGMSPGAYRLELLIGDQLAALTNFWVTGGVGGAASFGPVVFAENIDRQGNPVGAAQSFTSGLQELHAFSDYAGMEDGLSFSVYWYIDGEMVIEDDYEWDGGESGDWHYYIYSNSGPLPDGEYGLELEVEGQLLQSGSTVVGTGAPPPPPPRTEPEDGVRVQGTITDLDTGRPIQGAIFMVLNPGISLDTFQWTDDEIYTTAETDRQGNYELPRLLERGQCYTMIMGAEGYWPYGEDDVCVGTDAPSVVDLPVRLEKK
jgi:serine protease Do